MSLPYTKVRMMKRFLSGEWLLRKHSCAFDRSNSGYRILNPNASVGFHLQQAGGRHKNFRVWLAPAWGSSLESTIISNCPIRPTILRL